MKNLIGYGVCSDCGKQTLVFEVDTPCNYCEDKDNCTDYKYDLEKCSHEHVLICDCGYRELATFGDNEIKGVE